MAGMVGVDTRWWAVDKVIFGYFGFACVLLVAYGPRTPDAWWLFALHLAASVLLWWEVKRPNPTSFAFRHWYPLPYVAACYREMAIIIPATHPWNADQWLADLDFRIWGAHPTVWLERVASPLLTEVLQVTYSLFVPAVLLVPALLWYRRLFDKFRYAAFLIALGYLVSYVGYLLVPARGPRFLLQHLQTAPLQGLWLSEPLRDLLDRLESAHYDCFPSGHTELIVIAWWLSRSLSRQWFQGYLIYTAGIVLATIYLRYHYTVDVFAGLLTAASLIALGPSLFHTLSPRGSEFGGH